MITKYLNIYIGGLTSLYDTKEQADKAARVMLRSACVEICYVPSSAP